MQRSDDVAVVRHCAIVFACDRRARATLTASWYRQMGFRDVYALDSGTSAWHASGRALESGAPSELPAGYLANVGTDDEQVQTCQGGTGHNSWSGAGQVNALSAITHTTN